MNKCAFLHIKLSEKTIYSKKLYNMYAIHKMIWELWRHKTETPFIFRMKDDNLYVLYNIPIENKDVEWLKESRTTKEKEINFNGTYSYDIIVNPVKRDMKSRKIIPFKKDENILSWMERKGKKSGFDIDKEKTIILNKYNDISNNVTIFKANIRGILKITDPCLFNRNFIKGFGRAKRFGCGLMLIEQKYN